MKEEGPSKNRNEDPELSERELAELKKINTEGNKDAKEARRRLGDFLNAKDVLVKFLGKGIADEMPLGRVIMVIKEQEAGAEKSGSIAAQREIEAAEELLVSFIGKGREDLTENTQCGEVIRYIDKEIDRLTDIAETED